jgi:K+-sensing histidine kinase KdpD
MTRSALDADQARQDLYAAMRAEGSFEEKAEAALELGERYLSVENGHLTKIDEDSDYWRALASTDPADGQFPPGMTVDLGTTYCRRVLDGEESVRLHDAPAQGWGDDPAYETHGLRCYHGTPISVGEEQFGTVCFVAEDARREPFTTDETMFAELIARMLEHELQRRRTAAKLRRLDQFASVVSHDLRNPLNVAQGRIDLARKEGGGDHLARAAQSLDRMESLIADVLALARQGQDIDATTRVTLAAVAEECWQSVDTAEADLVVEDRLAFEADRGRVCQLFENLFRNAVEHGSTSSRPQADDAVEHDRSDVRVRVGALPDGFYVEDDGPGIPEAERESVFEAGHSTGSDGIGIGLSIVESVVSAHDWTVTATEGEDGGARFEVGGVVVVRSE